jgi:hypothetical protein
MSLERLLSHFLTAALGLTLGEAIREASTMPTPQSSAPSPHSDPPAWAAWNTDRGVVRICGAYDGVQSRQLNAHVVYLEWWIAPATHHAGWWRCDPQRPRAWTKGYGNPISSGAGK